MRRLGRWDELERERQELVERDGPWTRSELNRLGEIHGELEELEQPDLGELEKAPWEWNEDDA